MPQPDHLRRIRFWLAVFIVGLVLSGITAFPLQTEIGWLVASPDTSFGSILDLEVSLPE